MRSLDEIQADIEAKQSEIDNFELDVDDYILEYEQVIDDNNNVVIDGIEYLPSSVLQEIDETAFNEGLSNFVDSMDKQDNLEYCQLQEELEKLENELLDTEDEIANIEG